MGGGKITLFGTKTENVWMVKWKHLLQFMGLVYIWHVEMSFQEEKNSWNQILITRFWRYTHQRKASRGHTRVYWEYTLRLLRVQRTRTDRLIKLHIAMWRPLEMRFLVKENLPKYCTQIFKNTDHNVSPVIQKFSKPHQIFALLNYTH